MQKWDLGVAGEVFKSQKPSVGVISPIAVKKVFISVDSKSTYFVSCCAKAGRSIFCNFCEAWYLQSSFAWKLLAIRRSNFYTLSA